MQKELGSRGFQAIEAAINENPDVPGFIRAFKPAFPVGVVYYMTALDFMAIPPVVRTYVPWMAFVDRAGMVVAQHTGNDSEYFTDDLAKQTANIRADIEKLLAPAKPPSARKSPPQRR